ncbi:hypothetical protein BT96DRAFT_989483 [Gymnopus androsaceus JB14]|uniref:Extracellular membrane protein CFEM domain-containing protein n=1 Tax=Gymnopus androsaceus JB14 TaxID=1447944 RepID=A0A6A4I4X3_9AGAR|nr:hypothetical protein BT96DRAFT_989483 [Gymnopus androsaceus JB14]
MKLASSTLLTFVTVGVFASEVAASQLRARFVDAFDVLLPRQSSSTGIDPSDIPTECQNQCATVVNAINTCTTDSCFCTAANANGLESCFSCFIQLNPSSDEVSLSDDAFSSFNEECAGTPGVPTLAVDGSDATATGASSPKSTTGTKGKNGALSADDDPSCTQALSDLIMKLASSTLLTFATIGVFASEVAASQLQARFVNTLDVLLPRQSTGTGTDPSDIPTQCQSQCDAVVNALNTCTSDSCICTPDNANGLESCVECLINIDPTDEESSGEEVLSCELISSSSSVYIQFTLNIVCCKAFNEECAGTPGVPTLAVGGSDAGTGTSVIATTATGTSAISASAIGTTAIATSAIGTSITGAHATGAPTIGTSATGASITDAPTTGTSATAASSPKSTTGSGSGTKGLNGAVAGRRSMTKAAVGVLSFVIGLALL